MTPALFSALFSPTNMAMYCDPVYMTELNSLKSLLLGLQASEKAQNAGFGQPLNNKKQD